MKSIINTEEIKKIVVKVVEKALDECASQHQASIDGPADWNVKYSENQPTQLKLTFTFEFDNLQDGKPGIICCQPVVGLTKIEEE